ncbi:glycoside hydrolase family 1 protein [Sphingobium sp. EM0848]|uniref:glycoside hydrolase family 1 protein n=1 Tax=Sphingobium sp. EM0848 TaxID=2743473 RepID=UPI00159BFD6C|nr:family 1 glycosylhydrolase [Sphingobium sp. EM0848]
MTNADLSRRAMLGICAAGVAAPALAAPKPKSGRDFPEGFLWGSATAAHQVEGNNVASDIWLLEHVKPTLFSEPSGDACDSLHRWAQDLDLVKALGLTAYRFGIEWARIEPESGQFSIAMLDHYGRMIDGCLERGLAPIITFSHFSVPRWFAGHGHFQSADGADLFARFCDRAMRHLGDRIAYAVTLNEPNVSALLRFAALPPAFMGGVKAMLNAAAKASGMPSFASALFSEQDVTPAMVAAHIKAYQVIKALRPSLPVGVGLAVEDDQLVGEDDSYRASKRRAVYAPWFDVIRTHGDFIGVQNYTRRRYDGHGLVPPPPGSPMASDGREIYPASLGNSVRYAHQGTGKPVLITESGIAASDDTLRQAYIPQSLTGLKTVMDDGVPVLGYTHWSLLDNFEWVSGYGPQFGLASVDRKSFARQPKPSALIFSAIARSGDLP